MDIGKRIKNLREINNLTQDELAKYINTTKQTIFKYESGIITNIPMDKLTIIANALNCTPAYLLGWEEANINHDIINMDDKQNNNGINKNQVVSIGRGGQRRIYEISDDDAAIVDAFLEKMSKKNT